MAAFLSGLQLSEKLYTEIVRPVLDDHFPQLAYAAALIGWGSEVLGFDDPRSTDHNWGPRLQLFLSESAYEEVAPAILACLDRHVPATFYGQPTDFEIRVPAHQRALKDPGLLSNKHQIELNTVPAFFQAYLGIRPDSALRPVDWLLLSEHRLLGVTSGRVFYDGTGELRRAREKVGYYPDDVWLYLLAVQWSKLAEQEAFAGRSGEAGDDLGSRLIAARQVRLMIHLCFLMERRYAPYSKWLGTAFSRLGCAATLAPIFDDILRADGWRARERQLSAAYETLARMHNELHLTTPLDVATRPYYDRPYQVLFAGRFAEALLATVADESLRALPFGVGSINQFVDSDITELPRFGRWLRRFYQ